MNEYEKLRRQAALYRLNYPPGTRVMLLHMTWDNGRSLALVPGEDTFRQLTQAELTEEQTEALEENEAPSMGMTM